MEIFSDGRATHKRYSTPWLCASIAFLDVMLQEHAVERHRVANPGAMWAQWRDKPEDPKVRPGRPSKSSLVVGQEDVRLAQHGSAVTHTSPTAMLRASMRVTFVAAPDNLFGGHRVIGIYAKHLQALGHEVNIVMPSRPIVSKRERVMDALRPRKRKVLELRREVAVLRELTPVLAQHPAEGEQEEHAGEMHADAFVGAAAEGDPHEPERRGERFECNRRPNVDLVATDALIGGQADNAKLHDYFRRGAFVEQNQPVFQ